jgi:hypothetical protein
VLRLLRSPGRQGPAPLTRLLALVVVVAMIALAAPLLVGAVGWVLSLL